jgi:hypothetical protein
LEFQLNQDLTLNVSNPQLAWIQTRISPGCTGRFKKSLLQSWQMKYLRNLMSPKIDFPKSIKNFLYSFAMKIYGWEISLYGYFTQNNNIYPVKRIPNEIIDDHLCQKFFNLQSVFVLPLELWYAVIVCGGKCVIFYVFISAMAGNIIPAIATTNAIIAGLIVTEALKILEGRIKDCRTVSILTSCPPFTCWLGNAVHDFEFYVWDIEIFM